MFYVFVLRFGIFIIKFGWIDERMQSESFQERLNAQNIAGSKSTFWWRMSVVFDTFPKFHLFIKKSIWEASLVAKLVVEFDFEH